MFLDHFPQENAIRIHLFPHLVRNFLVKAMK